MQQQRFRLQGQVQPPTVVLWRTISTRAPSGPVCAPLQDATSSVGRRSICRGGSVLARASSKKGDVLLIADTLSKTFDGEKELFTGLTFSVVAGDKLAVVGPNGCGKSTLLKVIAGVDAHDSGWLSRNKGARVGYLPQDPPLPAGKTILQAVLSSDSDMARACMEYQSALVNAKGNITKELETAIEKMNTLNAWEIDAEAKRVLEAVGIGADVHQLVDKLSGGQRKRVALAAALLGKPDLLVLDEPTNHMDVGMINFLEKELAAQELALVLVSHDRYFMENVCDRLLELDKGKCFLHDFGGAASYDTFKEAREFRRRSQANAAADARTLFRRESEWMAKQPRARQAKSMARQNAFYELRERTKDDPEKDLRVDFAATGMARQGNKVVRLESVSYQVGGRTLLNNFDFDFVPGDRLGIVGPNGAGKSTLLDLISGVRQPTSGRRDVGDTTLIGYFTQYPPPVRQDMRIIDYIREIADDRKAKGSAGAPGEVVEPPEILLEKVGFMRPRQYQKVSSLSGGERRRLHLASVLIERPNVLILDEPTNDLDLTTVEVVEEVLRGFKGLLLVVSHDRAFMDNVVDKLLVLRGDGSAKLYEGSYTEYLQMLEDERTDAEAQRQAAMADARSERAASGAQASSSGSSSSSSSSSGGGRPLSAGLEPQQQQQPAGGVAVAAPVSKPAPAAPKKLRKLGFYEQEEYKKIGKEIDTLGLKRDQMQGRLVELAQQAGDAKSRQTIESLSIEMASLQEAIDTMSERWLELAEIAGDI